MTISGLLWLKADLLKDAFLFTSILFLLGENMYPGKEENLDELATGRQRGRNICVVGEEANINQRISLVPPDLGKINKA